MKLLAKLVGRYMTVKEERECGENAGMGVRASYNYSKKKFGLQIASVLDISLGP